MDVKQWDYESLIFVQATCHVMLGEGMDANKLLLQLANRQTDPDSKNWYLSLMNKTKGELLKELKGEMQSEPVSGVPIKQ